MRKRSYSRVLFAAALLLGLVFLPGLVFADPVAFQGVGASSQKLANGNTMLHFTVRLAVNTTQLVFNYHWERSDGAKSQMKMWSVRPGVSSIPITTTWEIGPNAPVKEVWEKLFVNTGNTHLESEPVKIVVRSGGPGPPSAGGPRLRARSCVYLPQEDFLIATIRYDRNFQL